MDNRIATYPDLHESVERDELTLQLIEELSSGGDARITLDPETGLNRYFSAPYPRSTLAYASSTANDLSLAAFSHLRSFLAAGAPSYQDHLADLRRRIRNAYQLDDAIDVVFAPSGTDLEYVALAAVLGKSGGGIHNILLGADEVGSGCIHSAHARYFAKETALAVESTPGVPVEGFSSVSLADIPVRCIEGVARCSTEIAEAISQEIAIAVAQDRHALVHVVHGSKTGLILPELDEIDTLARDHRGNVSFVVDACQARITTEALQDYLKRGAMVFLTGSKFMGGAPFNGFALVPRSMVENAGELPEGFSKIFRQAEFLADWKGTDHLVSGENPGLALRFEASVFELERFQRLRFEEIERIINTFTVALEEELVRPMGLKAVFPHAAGAVDEPKEHPIEMRTLVTLDLDGLGTVPSFDVAQDVHKSLAMDGLRLGQPVKCVRIDGRWGGTLRIGLSMPQIVGWAALSDQELERAIRADMALIATKLSSFAN